MDSQISCLLLGERLMPLPDCPAIVANCANGFARTNQSWALGRLLRDHETRHKVDSTSPPNGQLPSDTKKKPSRVDKN